MLQASGLQLYQKIDLAPTPFLQNTSRQLLLNCVPDICIEYLDISHNKFSVEKLRGTVSFNSHKFHHCLKSPYSQLFWSVFFCIRTENGPGYSPNTGHFLRSALKIMQNYKIHKIIQLFPTREK